MKACLKGGEEAAEERGVVVNLGGAVGDKAMFGAGIAVAVVWHGEKWVRDG